ncbi:uncharacterized protein LOC106173400 [Lingula anatina]|uniref:Uncharacterized protein LOC106173400 n=1 Tax=Lingula anatina TaxID=7574 RepID=A0A2R2MQS7_LINAN|nr:uncharacterized protein LOC106173400 [Lingula anatina]|eukprot:XP_023932600.1 uncharacterized protein LOC106173400 [Lingula anatina]
MTTRDNLKDVGTQYECLVSFKESSSSTPVKTMPAPPQLQESPIKIYEDSNDPLYEPGDLSFQEDKFSSPDTSDEKITSITPVTPSWKSERKYIVFESKLLELFSVCPTCAGPAQGQIVREVGSLVQVVTKCPNCEATTRDWNSQPIVHQLPVGNLVASAAILLSGSLPT